MLTIGIITALVLIILSFIIIYTEDKTMDKTAKQLIARIVSKVLETPTAHFKVAGNGYFEFFRYDGEIRYAERGGNEYWSQVCPITEDNLRYLLAEIGKNQP